MIGFSMIFSNYRNAKHRSKAKFFHLPFVVLILTIILKLAQVNTKPLPMINESEEKCRICNGKCF